MEEELSREQLKYIIRTWELVEKNLKSILRLTGNYVEEFPETSEGKKLHNSTRGLEKSLKEAKKQIIALKQTKSLFD